MITYPPKWIGLHERSARGHSRPNRSILPANRCPLLSKIDEIAARPRNDAKGQYRTRAPKRWEHYSITSSARLSTVRGTVIPSVLADLRLITSSYLVGVC